MLAIVDADGFGVCFEMGNKCYWMPALHSMLYTLFWLVLTILQICYDLGQTVALGISANFSTFVALHKCVFAGDCD